MDQNPYQTPPPIPQPEMITTSPRKSRMLLLGFAGTLLLGSGLFVGYFFALSKQPPVQNKQTTTLITPSPVEATIVPIISRAPDQTPLENTLYVTTYQGKQAVFYTNKQLQKYFDTNSVEQSDPNIGDIAFSDSGGVSDVDYRKLQNPQRILEVGAEIWGVSFKVDQSNDIVFVHVTMPISQPAQSPNDVQEKTYKVNLKSLQSEIVWTHIHASKKYPGVSGGAYLINVFDDTYAIYSLINCYGCEGTEVGQLIVNSLTKKEKFMEQIGNVQIQPGATNFSYQKLSPFKEPCEDGYGCENGYRTTNKPSGSVLTEKLP